MAVTQFTVTYYVTDVERVRTILKLVIEYIKFYKTAKPNNN